MKFYLLLISILLMGCQQTSDEVVAMSSTEKVVKHKVICTQSSTPPLQNKEKLKKMLLAKGKIDSSLPEKEIDQAVNDYIRKKNAAIKTKDCKK
ncbi:MAG: hypothetical protein HRT53_05040 [Colwellia sp.]|nr:hypothetical protein [Colwellia sp.]